ncbi:MAG: replicative DNA helicase [Haemophilus parainfluenzae]|jgi:replicative DNA helicase|uniref:Replicative DNA helicase n=2 Tax=Haemophilus TaxID=724 RepID=A0ABD7ZGH3_HAEPA|nr:MULTISPECIES: replicative DNA helicase [Haemophilus]EGC72104.1 replicative DNA helicase [Haemophilus parainfluenzae ATCC 33392]KFL98768.1 replicative DNA helicase [Haemophilus parainfluenzae ATCC 33392]MBF1224267.1 replicative DNA helicase [Haemophilus parainfluenzae]MBS5277016.1 replicative DNA helicase [Haemophilus parainfluenzae]MBS6188000.1 replicative DNA helicase [Haemophilus parainfluenzae]
MASQRQIQSSDQKTEQVSIPPHSTEAEQAVLGGIMLSNQHWDGIAERVIAEDFYTFAHKAIFQTMEELMRNQTPIDLITLDQALKAKGISDSVGGFAYLADLSNNTPNAINILAYAEIVREKAILRELIAVGNRIAENSYSPKGKDIKMVLDEAEREVFAIAEKRSSSTEGPQNVLSVLESTIARIETLGKLENHNGVTGVTTGFVELDKKTAGLQPSDLIIVAARPSMGKTTFAMNLCENAAMASDKPVLVFSLEMPAEQIMMRMIASLARVDQTKIRTGQNLEEAEWSKIASVFGMFKQKNNLYIDDSSGLTPTELRSRARRVYRENGGLSMIMVDYLQLMRAPAFSDNRTLEIAEISRSLKALAKELEVPVIALSQLNRTLEQRADKRPVNSDLRESGSIEQDADLIMFIYRDEVYNDNSEDKGVAEIIIGKQRNGPIGRVRLAFNGQFSRFDNLAEQREYRDDY